MRITLCIANIKEEAIYLGIPTWRPGRYEAANFAKNVRSLKIEDKIGNPLNYKKINHSSWEVTTRSIEEIFVSYEYYAFKMDAGNSWVDENLIYINFINCLVFDKGRFDKGRQNKSCRVALNLPDNYKVSCGLSSKKNVFTAKDFYELVDSPLIASESLEHFEYEVLNKKFHIWINGTHTLPINKLLLDFKMFTETQVQIMETFPEETFHFQILILPYKFYHGVEHHDSTVICIGPGEDMNTKELYCQLLGVCSHELFHAWNIIKIRPKELLPYQFDKEVVFPTGYVAEGFTTYYGDLFLVRSKVYNKEWYFKELNILLKKHFSNFGRLNYSVIDSSLDLWIDGYSMGTPHRKSSIYVEGAIIALCLDLSIRQKTQDKRSLDDVMRLLWQKFGKKEVGYSHEDIIQTCELIYGNSLADFFTDYVGGTKPKEVILNKLLNHVGCHLLEIESENNLEKYFGIKVSNLSGTNYISMIAQGSIGEKYFSIDDEIININGKDLTTEDITDIGSNPYNFLIKRNYKKVLISLTPGTNSYYKQYGVEQISSPSREKELSLQKWLG